MADEHGPPPGALGWLERLASDARTFGFHAALRRFEAAFPEKPRLGDAERPGDEPVRLGQIPSTSFEPDELAEFAPAGGPNPGRLAVGFLGLWGPQGPLPLHVTEYARDRLRHAGDATLAAFADIFHHRMLLLFHKAWARAQPTASMDRPDRDAFAGYVSAIAGAGFAGGKRRAASGDVSLFYPGLYSSASRTADGLRGIVQDHFGLPTRVVEFVGEWLELPDDGRWRLGVGREASALGGAVVGARVWSTAHKFAIELGPLDAAQLEEMLPGSQGIARLCEIVRLYTNDEWDWELRLVLAETATRPLRLGREGRLGWTTRLGGGPGARVDLVVDPSRRRTRRASRENGYL